MKQVIFLLSLAGLWLCLAGGPLLAQERLVTRNGQAQVPIHADDLDDARRRAVRAAQEAAVRNFLPLLLADEWIALYESDIRRRILAKLDRYISAYRVRKADTSLDRTQYSVAVEVQLDRIRLVADLRALSLPLLGDRNQPLTLLYPAQDPLLASPALREAAVNALAERLALLNIEFGELRPLAPEQGELLANPFVGRAARQAMLARLKPAHPAVMYLATVPPQAEAPRSVVKLVAALYMVRTGELLVSMEQPATAPLLPLPQDPEAAAELLLAALVAPLALQMQPGKIGDPATWRADGGRLELRVLGLRSIYDEERFERDFFQPDSTFENFILSRLAADSVTYEGTFRGERHTLAQELRGKAFGVFHVRRVYWFNDTLELRVQRLPAGENRELKPFPPGSRIPLVEGLLTALTEDRPDLDPFGQTFAELEDNGRFDSANPLLFDAKIYGFLDARSDSDLYVAEFMRPGEVIEIEWIQMGRTNLNPVLRIHNEQGLLMRTFFPEGAGLKFKYWIPKGEHGVYLEVADRYGYLNWEAGGYQNCHYLLHVHREGVD